jgi:hypothetical protein
MPERIETLEETTSQVPNPTAEGENVEEKQAAQFLIDAQKKRINACQEELNQVLKKYGCALLPVVTLVGGSAPQAEVQVVISPR